jgi:hypothetical protein
MKWKWLAIAVSAALPTMAVAQDAKDNGKQDGSEEVRSVQERAEQQRSDADMARAKAGIQAQAYDRLLGKIHEQKSVKAAWLGLSASQPPQALRRQLKLQDGTGLVIDFIQPESPAARAGLRQYDLLTRLNDQILINAEQLSVLVRTFKPGNKVHLEFLREGERQSVDTELAEHEVPPLTDENGFGGIQQFQFQPSGTNGFGGGGNGGVMGAGGGFGVGGAPGAPNRGNSKGVRIENHTISLVDGRRQLSIDVADGHRVLTVLDARSGRVMSKYPIDSDQQIQALPADVKGPLGRLLPLLDESSDRANPGAKGIADSSAPSSKQLPDDPKPVTAPR